MSNNIVGFDLDNKEVFYDLIMKIVESSNSTKTDFGLSFRYVDESGAEIDIFAEENGRINGVNFHYNGESKIKSNILSNIKSESYLGFEKYYDAFANPNEEGTGIFKYAFIQPNGIEFDQSNLPINKNIQLTGIVYDSIVIFDNENKFHESQKNEELKYNSQSMIPLGLFGINVVNTTLLIGKILKYEIKTNTLTNNQFYWFLIQVLDTEIDIVCGVDMITTKPEINNILKCECRLSGIAID